MYYIQPETIAFFSRFWCRQKT